MGANSAQGIAVLVFMISFTLLSAGLYDGGNILLIVLAAATFAASVAMFLKAKPLEDGGV